MGKLDDIPADVDTVMTKELKRLFMYADCYPTKCHACKKLIRIGEIFKLQTHNERDEMLCAKCGPEELVKRDKRLEKAARQRNTTAQSGWGGYSRPSKGG